MPERPLDKLLDREYAENFISENFSDAQYLLQQLTNYGTILIARCMETSNKGLEDIIVLGTMLKQAVEMLDSVDRLFSVGCINPAFLQLRVIYELHLFIKWILASDTKNKARHYYVWNLLVEIKWHKIIINGTPESAELESWFKNHNLWEKYQSDEVQQLAKKRIEDIEEELNKTELIPIYASFKNGKVNRWYKPLNVKSLRHLTEILNCKDEYLFIYDTCSKIVHSSSYEYHISSTGDTVGFKTIRNPENIIMLLSFLIPLILRIYRYILKFYRPEEIENFKRKYIEEWRSKFLIILQTEFKYNIQK